MLIVNCKSKSMSVDGNDMAYRYFADIRKYKPLSNEEQKKLLYIVKHGNNEDSLKAREKLIMHNQRFVASVARHLTTGDDFNDLVSEGTLGLNRAIDKFNLDFKQSFITYAVFWINKYMVDYLISDAKMIVPKNANKVYAYAASANNKFFLEHCRYPSAEELQAILEERGIDFANKDDLMLAQIVSVDEIDPDYTVVDEFKSEMSEEYMERTSTNNVENEINEDFIRTVANVFLSYLTEREQYIIRHYYGIGCTPETFLMISSELDTDSKAISKEYDRILKKLQKIVKFKKIRNFLRNG